MFELNWNDAQWQTVNREVSKAFEQASVACAVLPCYGPLAGGAETVRNERLSPGPGLTGVSLDADHNAANLKLVNLTVQVRLSSEQVADETMVNALLAFRRAANILALEMDRIVFDGFNRGGQNSNFVANTRINPQKGLADPLERLRFDPITGTASSVIRAIVRAIRKLENNSNPGPFACVLGDTLFEAVHVPTSVFVFPADRIPPILKAGRLQGSGHEGKALFHRSGMIEKNTGIVVSLAANAVDIVIGSQPTVQFLGRTAQARFFFRVYERFVVRLRDRVKPPVEGFILPTEESIYESLKGADQLVETAQVAERHARDASKDAKEKIRRLMAEQSKEEQPKVIQRAAIQRAETRWQAEKTKAKKAKKRSGAVAAGDVEADPPAVETDAKIE